MKRPYRIEFAVTGYIALKAEDARSAKIIAKEMLAGEFGAYDVTIIDCYEFDDEEWERPEK
jgi:hypothetical protein